MEGCDICMADKCSGEPLVDAGEGSHIWVQATVKESGESNEGTRH